MRTIAAARYRNEVEAKAAFSITEVFSIVGMPD